MMDKTTGIEDESECLAVREFMNGIQDDPRVTPYHVSLFAAIAYFKELRGYGDKIYAFSYELMPLAKISSVTTYHRCIRDLHQFGYIEYCPSFDRFLGSRIIIQVGRSA